MLDALERISRKLVSAQKAHRIDYYVCPECDAPVILHAGGARAAYFAHASGLSDEDCARFVAGYGNPAAHELVDVPHDYADALQLQLRIKKTDAKYEWALEIAVPIFRVNYGSIVVEVGGRSVEINLEGNSLLYRSISAAPQSSPYKIVAVTPSYSRLASLERTCPALNSTFATVFGPVDRPDASGIARSMTLQPERTYAFIWAESYLPIFPEELVTERLATRGAWCGGLVTLPHQVSQDCYDWLEHFTQLKFIKAAPAIVPVWPPLIRSISLQRIETSPQGPFSFFVEHNTGALAPPVFARSVQGVRVAKADSCNAPVYELSPEGAKSVELVCTNGPRLDVDFQLDVPQLKKIRPGAVKLMAFDKDGIAVNSVLHNYESSTWFIKIRRGELCFKAMALPIGAKGQIKVRRNAEWILDMEFIGDGISMISPDSAISANADLANRLVSILRNPSLSVMIDFSSLGRALIHGTSSAELEKFTNAPDTILRQIRQYFLQFPDALPIESRSKNPTGNQLLGIFQKSKPTPKSLSHYRLIQKNIQENANRRN